MTKLDLKATPVKRETIAKYRGKEIVVILKPFGVSIGVKGARASSYYDVPYELLLLTGAKAKADSVRREKIATKSAKRV